MAIEQVRDRVEIASNRVAKLTARQRQLISRLVQGRLNKQIAHDLGLSERTVKMHRSALLKALDVRTVAEAIRIAIEAGF